MAVPASPLDPRAARPGGVLVHLSGWYSCIWGTSGMGERGSGRLNRARSHFLERHFLKVCPKFNDSLIRLPRMGFWFLDYRTVGGE